MKSVGMFFSVRVPVLMISDFFHADTAENVSVNAGCVNMLRSDSRFTSSKRERCPQLCHVPAGQSALRTDFFVFLLPE